MSSTFMRDLWQALKGNPIFYNFSTFSPTKAYNVNILMRKEILVGF